MKNDLEDRMQVYRIPIRPQYKRRRRQKKQNPTPFFLVLILILAGVFYFLNNTFSYDLGKTDNHNKAPLDFNFNFSPRRQNILLMGVDVAPNANNPFKGARSDTMLLISIAPYGKNVNVISIPRDSKVYLAGKNKADKINHAFAFGGAKLSQRTVEEAFGIKVNNYFAISNTGVIKMIDTLGGLPIYIEKPMKYDDYTAKLHINLQPGTHLLSGKQTEGYLRFRHDPYGDIGRIRRQQWFFNAMLDRLKDPSVIVKLPELLKILPEYIQTDISGYDLAKFVAMAKNVDTSTIQIATIPGAPSTKGVTSYWIVDPEKTQELINKMVYREKEELNLAELNVGILYANSKEEEANKLKAELEEKGVQVKTHGVSSVAKDYIAVHNLDLTGETIMELKKIIPDIKEKHTIYDPIGINRTGKDLTIVIAG